MAKNDDLERHEHSIDRIASQILNEHIYPSLEMAYKAARLIVLDIGDNATPAQVRNATQKITKSTDKILGSAWDTASNALLDFAVYENAFQCAIIEKYGDYITRKTSKEAIQKYIDKTLMTMHSGERINSSVWSDWVASGVNSFRESYSGTIISLYQRGATVNETISALRSSTNGILKNESEALARTGLSHFANQAREAMANDNADIIKFRKFSAVFDNRTTLGCRVLDGTVYKINDENYVRLPRHFRCRSLYLYLTDKDEKSPRKQAVSGKNIEPNGNRKLIYRGKKDQDIFNTKPIDGEISQDIWLRSQPEWFIKSALGEKRAKLFIDKGFTINKFTDMQGSPITLDELKKLDGR